MSKILVESEDYFNLKEKINKLSEVNKSLKEKYVKLQKRSTIDVGFSIEDFDKIKNENSNLKKDITLFKQENTEIKKQKTKLLQDIHLFKQKNDILTNENKKLHKMIEEFENRKKTKNEIEHKPQSSNKKEFDINKFNEEYTSFIEKLKQNKHEAV